MLEHEKKHCAAFRAAMPERHSRPCRAMSLWSWGGALLGLITALMGRQAIWICTAAVEAAVHRHLDDQLHFLSDRDPALTEIILSIREEEEAHLHHAEERIAPPGAGGRLLRRAISVRDRCGDLALDLGRLDADGERPAAPFPLPQHPPLSVEPLCVDRATDLLTLFVLVWEELPMRHVLLALPLLAITLPHVAHAQMPPAIAAPGETAVATWHAEGAQVYECKAGADGKLAWAFREPIATLLLDGKTIGRHYAGPNWEHMDGSAVVGKVAGNAPAPGVKDIPWLKLEVIASRGSGRCRA